MKRFLIPLPLLLVLGALSGRAQSAYDQMMQIAGYSTQNVPPPSEPVCAYCRVPSRGAQPWDHQPGCPSYRPRPETQVQTQQQSTPDPYADERGNYARVTYPDNQVEVYIPPTPIRDTPEGQAILSAIDDLTDAVGSLLMAGLRDLISWGFDKIYESTHREYHSSDPTKGWGILQVAQQKGKEGVWNNALHKWLLKPGKYDKYLILDPDNCAAQKDGKWGIVEVTDKGRVLVPCQYDEIKFYTRGGAGSPISFGVRDLGGNMHWLIGRCKHVDGKFSFVPYEGEWSSVDYSCKPIPGKDDEMPVIVAKDAKTGKAKILNWNTKVIFGRPWYDEIYDNVFLTGMVEHAWKINGLDFWYDFYRVEKDGKMGFVISQNSADYKTHGFSEEFLPCEYDEITPISNVIGWKETKRWASRIGDYGGKDMLVVEKDGRFGVGEPSWIKTRVTEDGKLPFKELTLMKIPFNGKDKLPVMMGIESDGRYVPLHPDGNGLWWYKPDGYTEDGRKKYLYTTVEGYVLSEVMDEIQQQLRANPKDWRLTEEEMAILRAK